MRSQRRRQMTRRDFVCATSSAALAAGFFPYGARGAEPAATINLAQWRPCVDVAKANAPESDEPLEQPPVREDEGDPLSPVDFALIDQNPQLENEISAAPAQARKSAGKQMAGVSETRNADLPAAAPLRMAVQSKWDTDVLRVFFYGAGNRALKTRVLDIANEWAEFAKIDFKEATDRRQAEIRCAIQSVGGHWSYVGRDNIGVTGQTMNLELSTPPNKGEYNYGVVLHEFGHALGCIHEHQNPNAGGFFDPDAVRTYYRNKYGWSNDKIELNVLRRYQTTQLLRGFVTELDRRSIMMYSNPPELTLDRKGTPVNVALSDTDMATIARLYPGRKNVPKPPEAGSDEKPTTEKVLNTLTVDGPIVPGAITTKVSSNTFDFEITESGTYTLVSHGSTQIIWKLGRIGAEEVKLSNRTADLVNLFTYPELGSGKYRLEVQHKYNGGVGAFGIQLMKGKR